MIDTPHYQRLRDLYQLGSISFVFPSAGHSRFEHGIGTGYLSQEFLKKIKKNQPELEITESIERSLVVASLCHNIGHGPYSYPFTDFIRERLNDKNWDPLTTSLMMLDDLIDKNSIDLSKDEIEMTKDILVGEQRFTADLTK